MATNPKRSGGRPKASIRWTVEIAAREFGCDRRTLAKNLARESIEPGEDSKFSTAQILAATFGDREAEELREIRERADKIALENRKRRGELLPIEHVYGYFSGVLIAFREKILALPIEQQDKDDILRDFQKIEYDEIRKTGAFEPASEMDAAFDATGEADADSVGG